MATRIEIDCSTGEEKVIELTPEELAEIAVLQEQAIAQQAAAEAEAAAKAAAKAAAHEKLAALGLSADEIAAL